MSGPKVSSRLISACAYLLIPILYDVKLKFRQAFEEDTLMLDKWGLSVAVWNCKSWLRSNFGVTAFCCIWSSETSGPILINPVLWMVNLFQVDLLQDHTTHLSFTFWTFRWQKVAIGVRLVRLRTYIIIISPLEIIFERQTSNLD